MTAQAHHAQHTQHSALPGELLFTLDKAQHLSRRSGWAWSLTRNNRRIGSGSGMFGYPVSSLLHAAVQEQADALYLSTPPHDGFITLGELLPSLKAANIRELNIPSINCPWWVFGQQQKQASDHGITINRFPVKDIGNQIYYGPYTLATQGRPWVVAVCATTLGGGDHPLAAFDGEFGHNQRIRQRVLSSHALASDLADATQAYAGLRNAAGSELSLQQFDGAEAFARLLLQQAQMQLPTLVVITNQSRCQQLIQRGWVDELLLSCQLIDSQPSHQALAPLTSLSGWQMSDCHLLSNGVQLELLRKPY
ncbi:hypothetical protein [Ferrimonas kyonanensis]|uniref:hypothetical protein n=1 Tax=Ferrimonas kyonanensis TaxID=364763 RepID=UPI0004283094|nr:hypothetical protein [Ferrimonas kyonanensis]